MGRAAGAIRLLPAAVATPRDADDVARLVSWAAAEGRCLIPRGAGTGMPGGNVGRGISLDLTRLAEVGEVDPDSGIVEVGPGATGGAVDRAARLHGRYLPPLPSSAERCTVGGMVANNAAGARSFGSGSVRRWVMGAEAVLADGAVVRLGEGARLPRFEALRGDLVRQLSGGLASWPSVRKNASGYALDHFLPHGDPLDLLVGSEGTLGVFTRLWIRTAPLPEAQALHLVPVPALDLLDEAVSEVTAAGATVCEFFGSRFIEVAGLRTLDRVGEVVSDHPVVLLAEVEGPREAVDRGSAALAALARRMGVRAHVGRGPEERAAIWEIRHAASPVIAARSAEGLVSTQFIEDSVVPTGRLSAYLERLDVILEAEGTDAVMFGHAGDGNVHVNPLVDVRQPGWRDRVRRILDRTVELVADLGGTLSGEHGDGRVRAPFHDRIFGEPVSAAFRRVKRTLDPAGVLNPGVVVPLDGQDPLEGLHPHVRNA